MPAKKKYQTSKNKYKAKPLYNLKYPADLSADSDYIQFDHFPYEYNRRGGSSTPGNSGVSEGTIKLYMPNSTPRSTNEQEWESKAFPGEKGILQKEAMRGLTGSGVNMGDINAGEMGRQILLDAVLKQFGYDASTAMALSGKQYNPNIEMLYRNPKLRPFDFTFIFAPKNRADVDATNGIIKMFKQWSAPEIESGNKGFMTVPHLWHIRYMLGSGGENETMNKFMNLALLGVTTQDNPTQDTHMTFMDGTPVMTALSLSFVETDIISNETHAKTTRGY